MLLLLLACTRPDTGGKDSEPVVVEDPDADGYSAAEGDCDQGNAAVHPDAVEVCDEVDNDCDGLVDDADALAAGAGDPWYADADGDTFGSAVESVIACDRPVGYTSDADDCDDGDETVWPGQVEACDGHDNDCDGFTDEAGAAGERAWYPDEDGDGFAGEGTPVDACDQPAGYTDKLGDCDDVDPDTFPHATELCDEADRDCDGDPTYGASDPTEWHLDLDADGYGDDLSFTFGCVAPEGATATVGDCDDTDPEIHPAAPESCDEVDEDCDGTVDEDAADAPTWFVDGDGDLHGAAEWGRACEAPAGTTATDDDCDDTHADIFPGAAEACDGLDGDCDGVAEDSSSTGTAYDDLDADGFGEDTTASSWTCVPEPGSTPVGGDCDDTNPGANPDAVESCDGVDDDCDGEVDESGATTLLHPDADGDGFGDPGSSDDPCETPPGWVANASDCDDGNAATNPDATEACDGADNNCDGAVDESGGDTWWYPDRDADGYGDDGGVADACEPPAGAVTAGGDCDDTDGGVHPGATEICTHSDDNCADGTADESGAGFVDPGGVITDVTDVLAAGLAGDPALLGDQATYDLVVSAGTLHLCAGTWYAKVVTATAGTELRVVGSGADLTTLSTGGSPGSIVAVSNSTVALEDLTISGGIGSSSSIGGGLVATQTSGGATPAVPNLTLTRVVVSGNNTEYGGGVAIHNYGWVSLVDSLVIENSATIEGGGAWIEDTGKLSCAATTLGAAGFLANDAPDGGGVYFVNATHGSLSTTGCDWGEGTDDNGTYDAQIGTSGWCWTDADDLTTSVSCSGGTCSTSSDSSCP